MILCDANLLIYAVNSDATQNRKATAWLEKSLSGRETVGLSWNVLLAFLRVTTRPGILKNPLPIDTALQIIEAWLAQDVVTMLHPGPQHFRILQELLRVCGTGGNLTSDAHLAALAIEHGAVLYSLDADFARFPRLQWRNPLQ